MIFPLWDGDKKKKKNPPPPQPGMIEMLLFWLLCTTARPAGYFLSGKIRTIPTPKETWGKKERCDPGCQIVVAFFF